jgi:hypothetical protein
VGTKVSEAEFALLEERARSSGLTMAEWVRDVLLAAPVDGGPESGEVVLAEVLALRTLFVNLQFRTASHLGHLYTVLAGRKDGDGVNPGPVRFTGIMDTFIFVQDLDVGVDDDFARGINDYATNGCVGGLRVGQYRDTEDQ